MQSVYKGSVNRWECDENDHMNVRFYSRKLAEALYAAVSGLGLAKMLTFEEVIQRLSSQHIKYLREARVADPLEGYSGVVANNSVMTEIRNSSTGEVLCTALNKLIDMDLTIDLALPEHAAPRGLRDPELRFAGISMAEAKDIGFRSIGRGVIHQDECMSDGCLQIHNYMGRFSDSMPNLWGVLYPEATTETEGGAVLEYRMDYTRPLKAGDCYELVSGFREAGSKTIRFAHLLFDVNSQQCCVSSESIGVRMDLVERKAKTISTSMKANLEKMLIHPRSS